MGLSIIIFLIQFTKPKIALRYFFTAVQKQRKQPFGQLQNGLTQDSKQLFCVFAAKAVMHTNNLKMWAGPTA